MNSINLKSKIFKGATWLIILEFFNQFSQIFKTFFAARHFGPDEFGVVGVMLLILTSIDSISTLGLKEALIQKRENIIPFFNSAWTAEVIKGIVIMLLSLIFLFVITPFLRNDFLIQYRNYILIIVIVFFIQSCNNIAVLMLEKELHFKVFFFYNFSVNIVDVISTCIFILIYNDIWSLLYGLLLSNVVKLVLSFYVVSYRPKFEIDLYKFKVLFKFGKWIFVNRIIGYIGYQIDSILVSFTFPIRQLGLYQMSNRIGNLPMNQASNVISKIVYPTFSKLNHSKRLLKRSFIGFLEDINLAIIPPFGVLIIYMPELIKLLIGIKWIEIVPITRVLILAGYFRIYLSIVDSFYIAIGKPMSSSKIQISRIIVFVICFFPLAVYFKILGISIAFFLSIFFVSIYFTIMLTRNISISFFEVISTLLMPLFFTIVFYSFSFVSLHFSLFKNTKILLVFVAFQLIIYSYFVLKKIKNKLI